ncbi:hypothetical protein [Asaia krungthepensis]|uniref:DUF5666 domain-containing protein n=1 Tax=Asaia krungthepensis NRIC 0535 TaxID=1307925 RepID=A0ABQ0Q0V3_9PROT|nr:hypothetical protein [Asaia krungthepensis]GBQ86378.1 hypothetical protein AA0535_1006 [Asaia krungthepensis NRIC 0535]
MRILALGSCLAITLLSLPGIALAGAPQRIRGVITSVSGNEAVISTFMGPVTAHLTATTGYAGVKPAHLDDIHPDSFIGTAAVPSGDGRLRALEVTIFPNSMRGMGEGNYPWDLGKAGSMTNGAVTSMTNGTVAPARPAGSMTNGVVGAMGPGNGMGRDRQITVTYKGGSQSVTLPTTIPVVMLEPGDKSLLTPGAKVVAFGPVSGNAKGENEIEAMRIVVGEGGIKPPM